MSNCRLIRIIYGKCGQYHYNSLIGYSNRYNNNNNQSTIIHQRYICKTAIVHMQQEQTSTIPSSNEKSLKQPEQQQQQQQQINTNRNNKFSNSIYKLLNDQYNQLWTFYEHFVYLNEVRACQTKVIQLQEKLQIAQERRRHLSGDLIIIRRDIQQLYEEQARYTKADFSYVQLVEKQYKLLQIEKEKIAESQLADNEERDIFTHLTAAVRSSHEKERIYQTTVKYWSIFGSIIGAGFGILATIISYRYKNDQYNMLQQKLHSLNEQYEEQQQQSRKHYMHLKEILNELQAAVIQEIVASNKNNIKNNNNNTTTTIKSESWKTFLWRKTCDTYYYFAPKHHQKSKPSAAAT